MESGFDLLVERGFVYQSSNDQALRAALTRLSTIIPSTTATTTKER